MALIANKNNTGGNRVEQAPIEPGVYPARLVQVIDLGLQAQRPYKGQEKQPAHELMLTYELVDEFMKDEDGEVLEDKPRWVSETIPFHSLMADKAKSTKRYYALDPNEVHGGDFSQLVDTPINVTLVNNMVGEKTYTNVANVAAMRPRDAQNCVELKNEPKVFDLDAPDLSIFSALPQWIQDKIKSNLNYKGSALEKALSGGSKEKAKPAVKDEDDNPY